jgi:hypothetical protein
MSTREVVVTWCHDKTMMELAAARGWTEDSELSINDLVEESEADQHREFPTVTKAKNWARRNKGLDFWRQPSIRVYEYPDARRLDWQRERVQHLRYIGDGYGWEAIE